MPRNQFDPPQKQSSTPAKQTEDFRDQNEYQAESPKAAEIRYLLQLNISPDLKSKLQQAQALMSHKVKDINDMDEVLSELLDHWFEVNDPEGEG